jgi:hypothetical protein
MSSDTTARFTEDKEITEQRCKTIATEHGNKDHKEHFGDFLFHFVCGCDH